MSAAAVRTERMIDVDGHLMHPSSIRGLRLGKMTKGPWQGPWSYFSFGPFDPERHLDVMGRARVSVIDNGQRERTVMFWSVGEARKWLTDVVGAMQEFAETCDVPLRLIGSDHYDSQRLFVGGKRVYK